MGFNLGILLTINSVSSGTSHAGNQNVREKAKHESLHVFAQVKPVVLYDITWPFTPRMKLCQTGSFGVLNVPSLLLNCCYRKWPIWAVTQASISAEAVWGPVCGCWSSDWEQTACGQRPGRAARHLLTSSFCGAKASVINAILKAAQADAPLFSHISIRPLLLLNHI